MHDDMASAGFGWARPLLSLASPALRAYLERFVDRRLTLASIVEDSANPYNRVELADPATGRIAIRYRVSDSDHRRVVMMRRLMKAALAPLRYTLIPEAHKNERIAHACGTCRFGDDPRTSVLDRNCRAHGLENLYVVDASFFPTSGGTNPSLTIAANALRVAAHLTGSDVPGAPATTP
jgi:choline dehydrogenase-like flavoprotein